jgi:cell division topological specificity factor
MNFLSRVFRGQGPSSSVIAKERLQLVLVHDRVKISPGMLDRMKDELITVISRYVEIQADAVEVTLTQSKRQSRLVANIPVVGPVRRPGTKRSTGGAGAADGSTFMA